MKEKLTELIDFLVLCSQIISEKFSVFVDMARCPNCDIQGFSYQFSNSRANLNQAQNKCTALGGNLAKNLNKSIYRMLNNCCSTQQQYWIGLIDDDICNNDGENPFHWIGTTNECVNAGPFNLIPQNNDRCQAVHIQVHSPGRDIPQAQIADCTSAQRFICQIPKSTIPTTTTAIKTSPTAISQTSSSLLYTSLSKTTSFIDQTRRTTTPSVDGGVIGGVVVSCLVMLMLLIIMYLWRFKKKEVNSINCFGGEKLHHQPQQAAANNVIESQIYYG